MLFLFTNHLKLEPISKLKFKLTQCIWRISDSEKKAVICKSVMYSLQRKKKANFEMSKLASNNIYILYIHKILASWIWQHIWPRSQKGYNTNYSVPHGKMFFKNEKLHFQSYFSRWHTTISVCANLYIFIILVIINW